MSGLKRIPGPPRLLQIWLEAARKQAPPQSQCPVSAKPKSCGRPRGQSAGQHRRCCARTGRLRRRAVGFVECAGLPRITRTERKIGTENVVLKVIVLKNI
ncbi:hypothetical protein MTO96_013232 [Rhipicephalus appendiculatus]